jgi:hypothetical protein
VRIAGAGHAPWLQAPVVAGRAIASHLDGDDDPTTHRSTFTLAQGEQP